MARQQVWRVTSDLTGNSVDDESQAAELRVLSHPTLEKPVRLDAFVLEVQSLLSKNQDLVTVELVLPDDEKPIKVAVPLKEFEKLFKGTDPEQVLADAEPYEDEPEHHEAPRRRGRPAGSRNKPAAAKPTGSGMSKEQLAAVRDWANANGHQVSARGRIAAPVIAAFDAAHKSE